MNIAFDYPRVTSSSLAEGRRNYKLLNVANFRVEIVETIVVDVQFLGKDVQYCSGVMEFEEIIFCNNES